MKRTVRLVTVALFFLSLFSYSVALAAPKPDVINRQTMINNITDFLATLGKDKREAQQIIRERKTERREYRLKLEAKKKDAAIKKRIKRQNKIIMDKVRAGAGR